MSDSSKNVLSQLTIDSSTFTFIEYFLRLNLHASTAKIIQAYEVSNPQLTLQFEKRSKNLLTVDSWIDVDSIGGNEENNSEELILERGFQFVGSGAGMRFPVGRMRVESLSKSASQNGSDGKVLKRLILCKVAVGRAYNAAEDFAKIATIPDSYDSFVLDQDGSSARFSFDDNGNPIKSDRKTAENFEFIVKDSSQILPTFVIVFEYDPEVERRSRQKVTCENCENQIAVVFCQADSANLCAGCDNEMHKSKLANRHVRIPLEGNGAQTFSGCRIHPDKIVEFFCPACSRPVCVHCKMVGHHSTGDAARHKLITVAEAYKSVAESANSNDPILETRKATIKSQVQAVEERARQVTFNASQVQAQLDELYKKAQSDLKSLLKKKLNILKGDTVELERQLSEISQLERFLEYQKTGPNATQFILDWAHHQRLRSELHSFPYFRDSIDVLPDIRVHGGIQVHIESALGNPRNENSMGASIAGFPSKGNFSPSRTRATPTIDLSAFKSRMANEFSTADLTLSMTQVSINQAPVYQPPLQTATNRERTPTAK